MVKAKKKVPKFKKLDRLDAWVRAQEKNSFDRKEKKSERKRLKRGG